MTPRLKPGNKRQAGFSFVELMGVVAILGILAGFLGISIRAYINHNQLSCERTAQRLIAALDEKRMSAKLGVEDLKERSLTMSEFSLGQNVELVHEVNPAELPDGVPFLAPPSTIEFEEQSGRAVDVHGMVVLRNTATGQMVGIFISQPFSPMARYVKYPGWQRFEKTSNAVR